MSVVKPDPHPIVATDPQGNTVDVVTSAPAPGSVGLVVYTAPSSAVGQVQTASEGPTNTNAPADATLVGGVDSNGKLQAAGIDANAALKTSNIGVSTLNGTNQISVGTTATQIIAANLSRAAVLVTNTSSSVVVFLGTSGVTTANGHFLGPLQSQTFPCTAALFGIVASGTQTVTYMELLP